MSKLTADRELYLVIPLFSIGAAVSLGIVGSDVGLIDLSRTLIGFNGVEFTIARIMSLVALGVALVNRDTSLTDTGAIDVWAVWVTVGLVVAPPLVPLVEGTLAEAPYSFVAFGLQTMGITIVSYVN